MPLPAELSSAQLKPKGKIMTFPQAVDLNHTANDLSKEITNSTQTSPGPTFIFTTHRIDAETFGLRHIAVPIALPFPFCSGLFARFFSLLD